MSRRAPRAIDVILAPLVRDLAPATSIAAVQEVWRDLVGPQIAAVAAPLSERDGVLTVACREAVWAHELDMMGPELTQRINTRLGREVINSLRCRATPPPETL